MPEKFGEFSPMNTEKEESKAEKSEQKEQEQEEQSLKEKTGKMRESQEFEADLVIENPEFVGLNFDQSLIVDNRGFWDRERCVKYLEERGDDLESFLPLLTEEEIKERAERERSKLNQFNEYFGKLKGNVKHTRINPAGEMSPVSPSQAIEIISENKFKADINEDFLEQLRAISENCEDTTLVVPFYNHRREKETAGDIPETGQETEQYIAVCERIIEECGDEVILEIGSETNVSKQTGVMFRDKLQHASRVDPEQYADFYAKVAGRLKERFPELRLAVSGIACYDPKYLEAVLARIEQEEPDKKLVDRASFHPYRTDPERGSVEVRNGQFAINELNYEEQLKTMKEIASEHEVDIRVGEINFPIYDPEHQSKLRKAIELTEKEDVESLIYPGINTP